MLLFISDANILMDIEISGLVDPMLVSTISFLCLTYYFMRNWRSSTAICAWTACIKAISTGSMTLVVGRVMIFGRILRWFCIIPTKL